VVDLKWVCELSLTNLEAEMKYCGIDLHSNNSLVSVVDEEDHVVAEKRLPAALLSTTFPPPVSAMRIGRSQLDGSFVES
jgi:hypothetical protein